MGGEAAPGTASLRLGGPARSPASSVGDDNGLTALVFERTGVRLGPPAPGGASMFAEDGLGCGAGLAARDECSDGGGDREKEGEGGGRSAVM